MTGPHIIVYGDPINGYRFVGPFDNGVEAMDFVSDDLPEDDSDWWVAPLEMPDEEHYLSGAYGLRDGSRFWVVDSHEYGASQPHGFVPDEYVGLVDEDAGGIVAFGSFENIEALVSRLNADPDAQIEQDQQAGVR